MDISEVIAFQASAFFWLALVSHRLSPIMEIKFLKPQSHWIVRLLDRAISGDLVKLRTVGNVLKRSPWLSQAVIALKTGRRTIGGTCSRAITKDWRRLIVRSIVGNRATSRGDQQLIVRSIVATYDRSYDRSWRPTTDRGDLRPIVRSIVATYDRSWRPTTDRTFNRDDQRPIVTTSDQSYDRS